MPEEQHLKPHRSVLRGVTLIVSVHEQFTTITERVSLWHYDDPTHQANDGSWDREWAISPELRQEFVVAAVKRAVAQTADPTVYKGIVRTPVIPVCTIMASTVYQRTFDGASVVHVWPEDQNSPAREYTDVVHKEFYKAWHAKVDKFTADHNKGVRS